MAKIVWDSEEELETYIYNHIKEHETCPLSGDRVHICDRQLSLGSYGILDLLKVEFDVDGAAIITILELKKEKVTADTIIQVLKYKTGVKQYFDKFGNVSPRIKVEVAAPEICRSFINSDSCFLMNEIPDLTVYTIDYEIGEGITPVSHSDEWHHTNQNFGRLEEVADKIESISFDYEIKYREYMERLEVSNIAEVIE